MINMKRAKLLKQILILQMVTSIKVIIIKYSKFMGKEKSRIKTGLFMKANLLKIKDKDKEHYISQMVKSILVNG